MSKKTLNTLLVLIAVSMYFLFIRPLYSGTGGVFASGEGINTLKNKKAEYDSALVEADKLVEEAKKEEQAYKRVSEEEKKRMDTMLPKSVDTIRLMHELSALSVKSGMPFDNLAAAESEPALNGKGTVTLNLSVKTSYAKFKEFMKVLETSMRLFSIKSVTFNVPEGEGELTTFNITLETYYLP